MLRLRSQGSNSSLDGGPGSSRQVSELSTERQRGRVIRNLKRRPVLYVIIALMVLLGLSSMATGFDLAVRLNYILLLLIIASWLWSRAGASQINADVMRPHGPFSVGDIISEKITLQNRGRTPKAWVEVEDKTDIPGARFRHVTPLGIMIPFTNVEASAEIRTRGEFTLGPLVIRVADPFSLFPREVQFEGSEKVLVYPRIQALPDFAAPNPYLLGEHSRRRRANVISTDVASVREYAAGDSMSRIHWLSTARTGRLMVKQFDQGSSSHLWVVFDQDRNAQAGALEESTDEYGATLAASIVHKYTRGFLPVGYAAHGSLSITAPPDQSVAHRERVLRHIAASRPVGETPLINVLSEMERDFSQSTSLIVITGSGEGEWIEALAGLQRRGVKINVVALDGHSFGGEDNSAAVGRLVANGIRTFRVRAGEPLDTALGAPVGWSDAHPVGGGQPGESHRAEPLAATVPDTDSPAPMPVEAQDTEGAN